MTATDRATAAVTEVAVAALAVAPGDESLMDSVLDAVRVAMSADTAGFYEHEAGGFTMPHFLSPVDVWRLIPYGRAPTSLIASLHPGIQHLVANRPSRPYAVTDLVSERAWWNSELGTAMRPNWGRNYQFAVPLPAGPHAQTRWVWVLGRFLHDFTPADREIAAALQPVLGVIVRQHVLLGRHPRSADSATGGLTQRELLVLDLLHAGHTASTTAQVLGISPRTVNKHLERIYRKLAVSSRHQAIATARSRHIL
jgi:DNA-binding CsgD family transcriptional regulator